MKKFWIKILGLHILSQAALEERDENLRKFFHKASHDLRTPLSIAKTNSEVVLMKGQSIPVHEALEAVRSNLEEIDRMSAMLRRFSEELKKEESKDIPPPFKMDNILPRINKKGLQN